MPMIGVYWRHNKPAAHMGHGVRVVKTDQSLPIRGMQCHGVGHAMRHTIRRRYAPDLKFEYMPTFQDVPSAVIAEQQFELVFWQII